MASARVLAASAARVKDSSDAHPSVRMADWGFSGPFGPRTGHVARHLMGRPQQHTLHHAHHRHDRPTPEWFGTAVHSTEDMFHLDVRQSGNGVLITSSPAEVDGVPAAWPLRLRNEDNGKGLNEWGAALAAGRPHGICVEKGHGFETALVFIPHHPEEGIGTLARVRTADDPDSEPALERRAERPLGLWAEAGENLRRIVPFLGPDSPPADEPEDCQLCPGCYRPVYESSTSHTLIDPVPVTGLCKLCADGSTLRSLSQAKMSLAPQQRAVLETVAAALG
jgi:hypothetical protein